uniref:HTH OST-type domain-containing protein n=1 Tax=Glossina austeni TaxID=7395 RepID=A0A1A9UVJ1_GLOAU
MSSGNSNGKKPELKHIASVVRALINSRKPPCFLRDILKDYPDVESTPLPYRSLGYKTAQELLAETGEFIFTDYRNGDTVVTAKYNEKSAHIAALVRGQKTARPSRVAAVKSMRRPNRYVSYTGGTVVGGFGDRNNNSSHHINQYNQHSNTPSRKSSNHSMQNTKSIGAIYNASNQSKDLRERLNSKRQAQVSPINAQQTEKRLEDSKLQAFRPILGAATKPVQKGQNIKTPEKLFHPGQSQSQRLPKEDLQKPLKEIIEQNTKQEVQKPIQKSTAKYTVPELPRGEPQKVIEKPTTQDPLKLAMWQRTPNNGILTKSKELDLLDNQHSTNTIIPKEQPNQLLLHSARTLQDRLKCHYQPELSPFQQTPKYNVKMEAINELAQYCVGYGYSQPIYKVLRNKYPIPSYSCQVHINDSIFSTYPLQYESEYLAQEACAKIVLEKFKVRDHKKPLPSCTFTDTELINKLYTELLDRHSGIFVKNLPEWFESTFHQSLPENWWTLMQTSSKFYTEMEYQNALIVYAKKEDKSTDLYQFNNCKASEVDESTVLQLKPISLPWSEDYWNIFITHCASTIEVWGRLFGNEYNVRFGALMNEIENYMVERKERPASVVRERIYLISINDCWHRVRVEELDKNKGTALCFFIDFGDTDWLPVDQLYICEAKFLCLPAQAVPFSLYGLEDFEQNPFACKHLDELLPTKSVVGKIFTKEGEFNTANLKSYNKIQVVIFDTSTQDDINLNHLLLDNICNNTPAPEIRKHTVNNVLVTDVTDSGDIYVQLRSPEVKYLQKLLQQIVASKFKREQHKVTVDDLKRSNLLLICEENGDSSGDGNIKWYRGALIDSTHCLPDDGYYNVCYVDYGIVRRTNMSKIFLLESLSVALSKFPAQAIKVRLHNIPTIANKIVARIRGLLPINCEALVKLAVPGATPMVTIYTRLEASGTLCTVNDAIRIEHELEGCCGDSNGDSNDAVNSPKSQGGEKMGSLSRLSGAINTTNLTTGSSSPQKLGTLPKLLDYEPMPKVNEYFEVRVTLSANPSNFTIQPYKDYPRLKQLMKELQEFCDTNDELIATDMVEIGQAYAAKNPDGFYHRATVVKKHSDMIHVSFCDFGDETILTSSQLKILPLKFRQLPKMAIQAKLYGIKAISDDWTLDDCLFFRKITVGQTFIASIKHISYDKSSGAPNTSILELELIDVSTDEDVYTHELLLAEERAVRDR